MNDLWAALGLVLVLEGVLYALFPQTMINMLKNIPQMPVSSLRFMGFCALAVGWMIVWWVRH
ncbi:DUF2065 domain-containing protein [Ghiorsea bivora]|uniref:DUF2065 domain-containing protein n=1 Tax=Ghiorsea bivora TaxID=1485545 RepID=UPI000571D477|nr:DUF2065 domain-containing protein [Ghiorsea bivora]